MTESQYERLYREVVAQVCLNTIFMGRSIAHGVMTHDDMIGVLDEIVETYDWARDTVAVKYMRDALNGRAFSPSGPPDWLCGVVEGGKATHGDP